MGRKIVKQAGIILFWLAVWFLLALAVNNKILMVTPLQTLKELLTLLTDGRFYRVVAGSLLRIAAGFVTGFAAAVLLAALSKRFRIVEELLAPLMCLMKAIPVASFVVLLLIWWGSSFLAVAVCFLVVLPNIYISTLEGLKNVDRNMTEMAWVFRLSGRDRFFYIYCPALKPFLSSSMSIALGMSWKSGVAAEIIGTPAFSIGEQIYLSKLYLNTAAVFAWTAVVILLSFLFEKGVLWLTERFFSWQPPCRGPVRREEGGEATLEGVSKRYGDRQVLKRFNATYRPGQTYYPDLAFRQREDDPAAADRRTGETGCRGDQKNGRVQYAVSGGQALRDMQCGKECGACDGRCRCGAEGAAAGARRGGARQTVRAAERRHEAQGRAGACHGGTGGDCAAG